MPNQAAVNIEGHRQCVACAVGSIETMLAEPSAGTPHVLARLSFDRWESRIALVGGLLTLFANYKIQNNPITERAGAIVAALRREVAGEIPVPSSSPWIN